MHTTKNIVMGTRRSGKLGVEKLFREVFIRVNTIEIEKQAFLEEEEWQLKDEED